MPASRLLTLPMLALMAFALGVAPTAQGAANPQAEAQDIDVDILAKLARERAKGNAQRARDRAEFGRDPSGSADGCGNIGIGNVFTGGNIGFRVPREITVVVTGDVISANNRCR